MKKNHFNNHCRIVIIVLTFMLTSVHCSAQSFGQAFLNGFVQGLNNMTQQQNRVQNRQQVNNQNGFSLSNTSATDVIKTISVDDGTATFKGFITNDYAAGHISYNDCGCFIHGKFDSNPLRRGEISEHGLCLCYFDEDGSWYYGYFKHGKMHGEGSFYDGKQYFDRVYNNSQLVSEQAVTVPKYNKADYDAQARASAEAQLEYLRQQELNTTTTTTTSKSNSRRTNSSTACGVCYGSGKCRTCSGKGYYFDLNTGRHACPSCHNHNGICSSCNGTGRH